MRTCTERRGEERWKRRGGEEVREENGWGEGGGRQRQRWQDEPGRETASLDPDTRAVTMLLLPFSTTQSKSHQDRQV